MKTHWVARAFCEENLLATDGFPLQMVCSVLLEWLCFVVSLKKQFK